MTAWWSVLINHFCNCYVCMSLIGLIGNIFFPSCSSHTALKCTPQPVLPPLNSCLVVHRNCQIFHHCHGSYQQYLQSQLTQFRDFVETHQAAAGHHQKLFFDRTSHARQFKVGEGVWLSNPTAGKLDPRWEGGWEIQSVKGPVTYEIINGKRTKVVHINRLQRRVQPLTRHQPARQVTDNVPNWESPSVNHSIQFEGPTRLTPQYPQRNRHPPDRYNSGTSSV